MGAMMNSERAFSVETFNASGIVFSICALNGSRSTTSGTSAKRSVLSSITRLNCLVRLLRVKSAYAIGPSSLGHPASRSMIEQKLARVQQRPEQVLDAFLQAG